MSKVNITIHQRPLTSLFLGILLILIVLFALLDVLAIIFGLYHVVSELISDKNIDWLKVVAMVLGGLLFYILAVIAELIQTTLKAMGEQEYLPVKSELERLVERNDELEKELSDAKLEIEKLLEELGES